VTETPMYCYTASSLILTLPVGLLLALSLYIKCDKVSVHSSVTVGVTRSVANDVTVGMTS